MIGAKCCLQTSPDSGLECDTRRVLAWRERGTRNNSTFVRKSSQYRRAGWMEFGRINLGGRTDLHIIRNGILTARKYADEILRPHVMVCYYSARPFWRDRFGSGRFGTR